MASPVFSQTFSCGMYYILPASEQKVPAIIFSTKQERPYLFFYKMSGMAFSDIIYVILLPVYMTVDFLSSGTQH
jgi:hypothetical protein